MEKLYCGNAKKVQTKFGEMLKISFSQKDLETMLANLSNGWINTVVKEKKNQVEGKATHYLEVDNWKPNTAEAQTTSNDSTDLPF